MHQSNDLARVAWQTSSYSQKTQCVQVGRGLAGSVPIRDSKSPDVGAHVVSTRTFMAFIGAVKAGQLG